jgi:hypothetical protein
VTTTAPYIVRDSVTPQPRLSATPEWDIQAFAAVHAVCCRKRVFDLGDVHAELVTRVQRLTRSEPGFVVEKAPARRLEQVIVPLAIERGWCRKGAMPDSLWSRFAGAYR